MISEELPTRRADLLTGSNISFGNTDMFRDSGLVTNYGEGWGLQNGRGACEVLPYKKRGGKSFSHAVGGEGGHTKFWGLHGSLKF